MNVKVSDLMTEAVVTTQPHVTVDHVRGMLERSKVSAIPVVDPDGRPVGIVSSTDLVATLKGGGSDQLDHDRRRSTRFRSTTTSARPRASCGTTRSIE